MKKFKEFIDEISVGHAATFAAKAHIDQWRRSTGERYIVHPTAVFRTLQGLGIKDRNILVAALLHDTIEDTPTTINQLKHEFNKDVAKIVKGLTSNRSGIKKYGKAEYLAHKMVAMDNDVLTIKLADRLNNLQDVAVMSKSWSKKYMLQTKFIIDALRQKRSFTGHHKKLVRRIEKSLMKHKSILDN